MGELQLHTGVCSARWHPNQENLGVVVIRMPILCKHMQYKCRRYCIFNECHQKAKCGTECVFNWKGIIQASTNLQVLKFKLDLCRLTSPANTWTNYISSSYLKLRHQLNPTTDFKTVLLSLPGLFSKLPHSLVHWLSEMTRTNSRETNTQAL